MKTLMKTVKKLQNIKEIYNKLDLQHLVVNCKELLFYKENHLQQGSMIRLN